MREIKFRGKTKIKGEWVYGHHAKLGEEDIIMVELKKTTNKQAAVDYAFYRLENETVGRFIERHDKNGKEAYEGDIVFVGNSWNENAVIIYDKDISAFVAQFKKWGNKRISKNTDFEIIGNIHDNPELLS